MFRSIRSRVVALSIALVTITTVVTTLTVTATVEQTMRELAAQSLTEDAEIYEALLDYGLTNRSWVDVEETATALATKYERRITLKTVTGMVVVDTDRSEGRESGPLRRQPDARIDPTDPSSPGLGDAAAPTPPARIRTLEQGYDSTWNETSLHRAQACMDQIGVTFWVVLDADGREQFDFPGPLDVEQWNSVLACVTSRQTTPPPLPVQRVPSQAVSRSRSQDTARLPAIEGCLAKKGYDVTLYDDGTMIDGSIGADSHIQVMNASADTINDFAACADEYDSSRVAGPVDLYLGSDRTGLVTEDILTRGTTVPAVIGILLASAAAAWLLAALSMRPLRRLTAAADAVAAGDFEHRIGGRGRSEVNRVARSFDAMSDRLAQNEELRRQMVDDISHEMRNPLTTIQGTVEAMQDGIRPVSDEVMQSVLDETAHLAAIVDDLALLQGADAHTLRLQSAPVDVGRIARGVADGARAAAQTREITLHCDVSADTEVIGDARRTRQIVANLVSNAVRYTPDGGRIDVTVVGARRSVSVVVADSGPGILAGDREHVFERFWRADAARSRHTGGSGLGLSIARDLARALGGEITLDDAPMGGARFTLTLPRGRTASDDGDSPE